MKRFTKTPNMGSTSWEADARWSMQLIDDPPFNITHPLIMAMVVCIYIGVRIHTHTISVGVEES